MPQGFRMKSTDSVLFVTIPDEVNKNYVHFVTKQITQGKCLTQIHLFVLQTGIGWARLKF